MSVYHRVMLDQAAAAAESSEWFPANVLRNVSIEVLLGGADGVTIYGSNQPDPATDEGIALGTEVTSSGFITLADLDVSDWPEKVRAEVTTATGGSTVEVTLSGFKLLK